MQGWIDVNDRKPDTKREWDMGALESDEVLGVDKFGRIVIVKYIDHENGDQVFEDRDFFEEDITHWMPLPEPPASE